MIIGVYGDSFTKHISKYFKTSAARTPQTFKQPYNKIYSILEVKLSTLLPHIFKTRM